MKILHIAFSINPAYGGIPQYVLSLVKKQNDHGMDAHLCTTTSNLNNTYLIQNSLFIKKKLNVFKTNFPKILGFSYSFKKFIDKNIIKYDLIHIHGLYRFPVSYAAFVARKKKISYIITPHGSLDPYLYRRSAYSLILKRLWEFFFDFPNIRNSSGIHCTSNLEKK